MCDASVIIERGVIGVYLDSAVKILDCVLILLDLEEGGSAIVIDIGVMGVEFRCVIKELDRFLMLV